MKSTGSSKMFILGIWELREVMPDFSHFLHKGMLLSEKDYIRISIIYLTDQPIFSLKSSIGSMWNPHTLYMVPWKVMVWYRQFIIRFHPKPQTPTTSSCSALGWYRIVGFCDMYITPIGAGSRAHSKKFLTTDIPSHFNRLHQISFLLLNLRLSYSNLYFSINASFWASEC